MRCPKSPDIIQVEDCSVCVAYSPAHSAVSLMTMEIQEIHPLINQPPMNIVSMCVLSIPTLTAQADFL